MIYESKQRAEAAAAELNAQPGYAPARAVLTVHGWTVIRSYRHKADQSTAYLAGHNHGWHAPTSFVAQYHEKQDAAFRAAYDLGFTRGKARQTA